MIDYKDILYFDCETTGLPPKDAKWDTDCDKFPRICQLSWIYAGREENHIIKPDGWEIPQAATDVHGITTEYALEHGEDIFVVLEKFNQDCENAKLICGHNIYFDVSVIKSEWMRLGMYDLFDVENTMYKGKRIDTMRPAMKFVDARFSNGRLKFPRLEELYAKCFPGESFPAHDAIEDVRAVVRCLPVLVEKGIIELSVKDCPPEQTRIEYQTSTEKPETGDLTGLCEKGDKSPITTEKMPQIENPQKITQNNKLAEMMADENF